MELILWRHAEAEDGPDAEVDEARELTPKGRKQARKIAKWLKRRIDGEVRVLASPALRAQQTAAAFAADFETEVALGTGARARGVLAAAGWPNAQQCVVAVGHQPTLGRVAALLMTGKENEWDIKKGSIWWFTARDNDGEFEVQLRAVMAPGQV